MARNRGFTLIELMVVVAIVVILAAIALPAFTAQIRKARRSDMEQALQQIALLEERFRADCPEYANAWGYVCSYKPAGATSCTSNPAWICFTSSSPYTGSYYGAVNFSNVSSTSYTLTVTAPSSSSQYKDTARGVNCSTLVYAYSSGTTTQYSGSSTTNTACWNK